MRLVYFTYMLIMVVFSSCAHREVDLKHLTDYQVKGIIMNEYLMDENKRQMRCDMAIGKNDKGTVIYRDPKIMCDFCNPPKRGETVFYTCGCPKLNHKFSAVGSWVLSCPDDHKLCEWAENFSGDDFSLVFDFLEANKKEDWFKSDWETVEYVIGNLSIQKLDYFLWLLAIMDWQHYEDKYSELDLKDGEMLFKRGII